MSYRFERPEKLLVIKFILAPFLKIKYVKMKRNVWSGRDFW